MEDVKRHLKYTFKLRCNVRMCAECDAIQFILIYRRRLCHRNAVEQSAKANDFQRKISSNRSDVCHSAENKSEWMEGRERERERMPLIS